MAKGGLDLIILQQERAGHALHVAGRKQCEVACHPGHQRPIDTFAIEILAELGACQPKSFVELAVGIGEARKVLQFIRSKKLGGAFFRAEMHKCDACASGLYLRAEIGELGDRLATKGSAKVTQENEQKRALRRERLDGFAILRTVGLQELRIDTFHWTSLASIFTDPREGSNSAEFLSGQATADNKRKILLRF